MSTLEQVVLETKSALAELFEVSGLKAGDLLVVGCSSSEIIGGVIGHASSPETGMVVAETILNFCKERGVFLAAQCCEHLNRALIVEETAAEKFGYEEVCVIPQLFRHGCLQRNGASRCGRTCPRKGGVGHRGNYDRYASEGSGCAASSAGEDHRCCDCSGCTHSPQADWRRESALPRKSIKKDSTKIVESFL